MNNQIDIATAVTSLATEITEKRINTLRQGSERYIPRNFYASGISDCSRQLVHGMLDWDKKPLADDGLLSLFESGKKEEQYINRMLIDLGFEIQSQQNPITIKHQKTQEIICTGRIDGKIKYKGFNFPYEIKSMNDHTFNSISCLEDFEKKPHLRKYLKQMQLYLYGNNIEAGLFIISNFRQIKIIVVYLDYGFCEQILQHMERAWEYVKKGEYPDPINYNPSICDYCPFEILCTKMTNNKPAEFIDNKELEQLIDRRQELQPLAKEFDDIDKQIKTPFKNKEVLHAVIGTKYEIIGRKSSRAKYNINLLDDETKARIKETADVITYKINQL